MLHQKAFHFYTCSVRSYIDKTKPDIVLLTYEPHVLYSLK